MYLLIAKRAERLPRDILAVAGRERRQPIRGLGAKRLVGIRERHRRENRDVVDPRCGGAALPARRLSSRARPTSTAVSSGSEPSSSNGREPYVRIRSICAWVGP